MKCLLLSPERTLFEGEVDSVNLPAHDGLMGVYPKHAPMIGLGGDGVLVLAASGEKRSFLVLGGFYRVADDVVSILSADALPIAELRSDQARAEEETARTLPARTDEEHRAKEKALQRAKLKQRLAK